MKCFYIYTIFPGSWKDNVPLETFYFEGIFITFNMILTVISQRSDM